MTDTDTGATDAADRRKPRRSHLARWWAWRGGWADFFTSRYTYISLTLLLLTAHWWLNESWWEMPIAILPNIVGFSLGGYAILLAFGDDGFRRLLVPSSGAKPPGKPEAPSLYMRVSSVFLHFILVQIVALMFAMTAKALDFSIADAIGLAFLQTDTAATVIDVCRWISSGIGFFLFVYSLALAAAAAMSVFQLSEWFEMYLKSQATLHEAAEKRRER